MSICIEINDVCQLAPYLDSNNKIIIVVKEPW